MRYMINYNESVMKVLNSVAEKLEEYGFKTCIVVVKLFCNTCG